jgi:hypothetical protein
MSRWTTLPTSLILLILSVAAASAADDLPRNIDLKAGAAATDDPTAAEQSAFETKTRQIVTEGKDAAPAAAAPDATAAPPADAAGKPDTPKEGEDAATAAPAQATVAPGPSPVTLRPEELAIAVQTELKRVGCYPGAIDGAWGGQSREALAAFGHFAKVDVAELAPTPAVLAIIKGKAEAVCVAGGEPQPSAQETAPESEPAPGHHGGGGGYYGGGGY